MAKHPVASLAARVEMLESIMAAKDERIAKLERALEAQGSKPTRFTRPDNSAILARMKAAKETAMRTGKVVKV